MSDPPQERDTFRPNNKVKAAPGTYSYGSLIGGGINS
jgi:hypothetical protein